jgi:SAM-dependent methyltransferase
MTEIDEVFEDALFAAVYDDFNPWAASDAFYLAKARELGGHILDLGCGTGLLACRIAAEGLRVVGVDPARGMLRVARSRPGAERVDWVASDGQSLRLGRRFDLVCMTGHAFQALLSDDDALAVLKTAAHHLEPHGRFVFETRNPAARAWLSWTPETSRAVVRSRAHGRIEGSYDAVADARTGIVEIAERYRFLDTGVTRVGRSRLRFIGQDHLAGLLEQAGLRPLAWYGDWQRGPLLPTSKEIIAVTERVGRQTA